MGSITRAFKYRGMEKEHDKDVLRKRELYFSPPCKFKDEKDCALDLRIQDMVDEFRSRLEEYIRALVPEASDKEDEAIDKALDESCEVDGSRIRELLSKSMGILSLSKTPISHCLWESYADNHKGFCIELDLEGFIEWANDNIRDDAENVGIGGKLVDYVDDCKSEILMNRTDQPDELFRKIVLTKHTDFSWEEEIRILGFGLSQRKIQVPPSLIPSIGFGKDISSDQLVQAIDWVRSWGSDTRVLKATTIHKDKVSFKEVDINNV